MCARPGRSRFTLERLLAFCLTISGEGGGMIQGCNGTSQGALTRRFRLRRCIWADCLGGGKEPEAPSLTSAAGVESG